MIEERKPKEYSEMDIGQVDVMYLTESERAEFHTAKQDLPSQVQEVQSARIMNRTLAAFKRIRQWHHSKLER